MALAEAEAIRTRAAAEAAALRIESEGRAEAEKTRAVEEAEKQRITNERQRLRLEKDQADHDAYLARKAAEKRKADAEREKAAQAEAEQAQREAQEQAERTRAERWWKWGARGIYAVGLVIAAPVQFMHFWDPARKFLVAAPALLEGLALVLACGAGWAVAHRRDVTPYRIGVMISALIAAAINMHGGMTKPEIGFNAGLIGAIASLGGPIVLMVYEHGIAQQSDGIPSRRERRASQRAKIMEDAARAQARKAKEAADLKAREEKAFAQQRAEREQARRDEDRRKHHPEVWAVADAMRSARGSAFVTEQIWAEAWQRVTGCKTVGITLDLEAASRAQQARVKTVTETPVLGEMSLVNSQRPAKQKKDPNAPDGRRNNGGIPPRRTTGDSEPNHPLARAQARVERTLEKKD
ncbi:hypothetical protein [Streptomyces spectabilis]|uniref:hypothetical protein n=1 Tax=Streptomyces spectabilis TaxID=68270 RepID=UPI003411DCE5